MEKGKITVTRWYTLKLKAEFYEDFLHHMFILPILFCEYPFIIPGVFGVSHCLKRLLNSVGSPPSGTLVTGTCAGYFRCLMKACRLNRGKYIVSQQSRQNAFKTYICVTNQLPFVAPLFLHVK